MSETGTRPPIPAGDVAGWLASPPGHAWIDSAFVPVDDQLGVFAELKPLSIAGMPMRWTSEVAR
jgi:hypothetical protein